MVIVADDFTGFVGEIIFFSCTKENEHIRINRSSRICNIIFHIRAKIFIYDNRDFIHENVSN